jgi:hypothetical protein
MPYDFAEQLFNATKLGVRVIVAPSEVAPVEFARPALFPPKSGADAVAAARAAEADEAANKAFPRISRNASCGGLQPTDYACRLHRS